MSPKALLFDFDGVILDTEWSIYQSILEVFLTQGHDLPLKTYVKCIGSDFATWSPESHLEELTGKKFDWKGIRNERNKRIRSEIAKLDAMPGLRDCLAYTAEQNIPALVVSSSSHNWVDGWLEKLNLTESFQDIVCKEDAKRIKPAPDLYLKANSLLPDLEPADCLVIEGLTQWHERGPQSRQSRRRNSKPNYRLHRLLGRRISVSHDGEIPRRAQGRLQLGSLIDKATFENLRFFNH